MNLLVVTTLYPNKIQIRHGIFVETRLRQLVERCGHDAVVIAPVPWFPLNSRLFPTYSKYAQVPAEEDRHGIRVYHPRYLVIPKIGMLLTPFFLALSMYRAAKKVRKNGFDFELLDAHYYYPDGVAVALVGGWLGRPFTITARGSDINVLTRFAIPRRLVRWAAGRAAATIAVSSALKERLIELGAGAEKIHVFRNGVDLDQFRPRPKIESKKRLHAGPCTLLSVGNLIELKGHDLVIRALERLPDCELLIVGDGELRGALESLAGRLGVSQRVRFLGVVQQAELVDLYSAADVLVLASSREGLPNVVLEAMACDTPVVATEVGGTPEVVCSPDAGVLVGERSVTQLVAAITQLLADYPQPGATRAHAEQFSWDKTISGLCKLFAAAASG